MLAGKAVMINWSDVAPEHRLAYYEWHNREHMVGRVSISGFCRGRRYMAVDAKRDFLILYEVENVGVLNSEQYLSKANAPSELTRQTTPFIKNAIRGLTEVRATYGIGLGGMALTLRLAPAAGSDERLGRYLNDVAVPRLVERPEITGAHWLVADKAVSGIVPIERQGRPTAIPDWVVVVEALDAEALAGACRCSLTNEQLAAHGAAPVIEYDVYRLQVMVTK
jgi:hypothetical protein